jgi:hypothetical protein
MSYNDEMLNEMMQEAEELVYEFQEKIFMFLEFMKSEDYFLYNFENKFEFEKMELKNEDETLFIMLVSYIQTMYEAVRSVGEMLDGMEMLEEKNHFVL